MTKINLLSEFPKCARKGCHRPVTGKTRGCERCKSYEREYYQRNPVQKKSPLLAKRSRVLSWVKLLEGCCRCGYKEAPEALDWHHIDGAPENRLNRMRGRAWSVILQELAKCTVLCANCHRIVHHAARPRRIFKGQEPDQGAAPAPAGL